jgi:hypothetical protein
MKEAMMRSYMEGNERVFAQNRAQCMEALPALARARFGRQRMCAANGQLSATKFFEVVG